MEKNGQKHTNDNCLTVSVRILLLNFYFCLIYLRLYDTQYTTYLGCSSCIIGQKHLEVVKAMLILYTSSYFLAIPKLFLLFLNDT